MSKQKFITELFKKRSTYLHPDQAELAANLLNTVSSDIYSESQRFIFELIQNADDAAISDQNEVHFDIHSDCLIFSHKGKAFDEDDICAITNAGKGTKSSDITKTGYKGIGFKSVFGKSNKVIISSDGYCFRFDKKTINSYFPDINMPWQIIPIWTEQKDIIVDNKQFLIRDNFSVSIIIDIHNTGSLQNDLKELLSNGKILLFLRRILKISVSVNGSHSYSIIKQVGNVGKSFNEVKLLKETFEISQWIVFTFDNIPIDENTQLLLKHDDKTPDKLKDAKFTEISFAARIDNEKIKAVKGEESLIFTYLPTKVIDFEFPFLVNASFLTNASREGIHEDRAWNQWLFSLIGEKIFEWIILLANSKFKLQILHLLPNKFEGSNNDLKLSFNASYEKAVKSKRFVPNKEYALKKASDIFIDKTGLSEQEFIPTEVIVDFINLHHEKSFTIGSIVNPDLDLKFKLNSIGAFTFNLENLEDFFLHETFKSNHQPSQNFNLIKFFFNKAVNGGSNDWNQKLKSIPFIYAKGKKLKSPQTVCFPTLSFETDFGEGVSVIHSDVYPKIESNPRIKGWLEELGVKEPSDIAYLENEILGNIETYITNSNYRQVTRYLMNRHKKGQLKDWHYSALEKIKLFTTNKSFVQANICFLSDRFDPSLKLENVFPGGSYVSDSYIEKGDLSSEWKTFFIKIGVSENISLQRINTSMYSCGDSIEREYFIDVGLDAKERATRSNYHPHLVHPSNPIDLNKISFSEYTDDYKFSKVFWEQVFINVDPNAIPSNAQLHWGYYGSTWSVDNYVLWSFKNSEKFPSTTKEILKADEIFINTKDIKVIAGKYLPVLSCDITPDEEWLNFIPFRQKIEIDDYLLILNKISCDKSKEDEIKNNNKKRIGAIYNNLLSLLPNVSQKKKNTISEWSKSHKLLCVNDKFENSADLVFVKIAGFSGSSEHLKIIFIPDNCDTNSESFEELLSLMGVKIIDEFIPNIIAPVSNASLKIHLNIILPYLVALLEKRQFVDYSKEYNRISKIIDSSEFINAQDISLSFKNNDEVILGPSLDAFLIDNKVYYKGRWSSLLVLYSLGPVLLKVLQVKDINEEIKLLISLDENDIKEWCVGQGIDLNALLICDEFLLSKKKIEEYKESSSDPSDDGVKFNNELSIRIQSILASKGLSLEKLYELINNMYTDEGDENVPISSNQHLDQKGKNESNEIARELVFKRLSSEGYVFTKGKGNYSVVDGVVKNGKEYPLVVKSYTNSNWKFNIRPYEWLQLSKPNSMFWVHRGGGKLEYLTLEGLLRDNADFHVHFETKAFSFEGLAKFAEVFHFVKNVHFQLDAPNFSMADIIDSYQFNVRKDSGKAIGNDDENLIK